jgi:large subunit ribosomal protein L6
MSRVAKNPVKVPSGVEVALAAGEISVKGPLGTLKQVLSGDVSVVREGDSLLCKAQNDTKQANAMSGTIRAHLANMVKGVSKGFERKLTLVGVGYRAQAAGDTLNLTVGYSHPVTYKMPAGVKVETPSATSRASRR